MATPQASLKQPALVRGGALLPSKPASVFSSLRRALNPSLKSLALETSAPSSNKTTTSSRLRSLCRPTDARSPSPLPSAKGPRGFPPGAAGAPPSGAVVLWVRSDLRLHDSPALEAALARCRSGVEGGSEATKGAGVGVAPKLLPVFVFDPAEYRSGRSGPYRARFLREAVSELRDSLRELGSDLLVRVGAPAVVLSDVASAVGASAVVAAGEASYDDKRAEAAVAEGLRKSSSGSRCSLELVWGGTAVLPSSLPWWETEKVEGTPATFAEFRAAVGEVSKSASNSSSSSSSGPAELPGLPATTPADRGDLPTDEQLSIPLSLSRACEGDGSAAGAKAKGGESRAVEALEKWVRNARAAPSDSRATLSLASALSPWLATGCLSARRAMERVNELSSSSPSSVAEEAKRELEWRDFFRFTTVKYSERALAGEKRGATGAAAAEDDAVAASPPTQRRQGRQGGLFRGREVERLWAALSLAPSPSAAPGCV